MRADVLGEAAERREDPHVVLVVGAQLEAVALRDDERDLEDVDRVEAEAFAVELRGRHDVGRCHLEIERFDQQHGQLVLERRLFGGVVHEEGPPEQIFDDPREERTRAFLKRIIEAGRL